MSREFTYRFVQIVFVIFAVLIGLYPSIYFFLDRRFGLLSFKTEELLNSLPWNIGFYTHIIGGGIALLIGWVQFFSKFRDKNIRLHRQIGWIYIATVMFSSLSGIYIGFYATGGLASSMGFISLGVFWFYTTLKAFLHAKNKRPESHKQMMMYSYAACFAAVMLRIWLPLLVFILGDFIQAYVIVAWLSWVPNVIVAYIIVNQERTTMQTL
ncbi:MAG: DUF2306 domain-containing protein [Leadbetterella sp.]